MKSISLRIFLLVAILSATSLFIYKDYSSTKNSEDLPKTQEPDEVNSTTTTQVQNGVKVIPVKSTDKALEGRASILKIMPNLDKKWIIPDSFNEETKTVLERRIADLNKILKADFDHYDKWIDLGILRKLVGDNEEARNIWEFASIVWPDSLVAFHNLGDIYHFYLKDYAKAEENMIKVIKIDPQYIPEYGLIHDLYKRQYGIDDQRTLEILQRGLKSNPDSVDLMILTAGHYREAKDIINARKYYEMALVRAKALNNPNLQKAIEGDIDSLR
jgi:tetratricopeptide (TPR) repeat protein